VFGPTATEVDQPRTEPMNNRLVYLACTRAKMAVAIDRLSAVAGAIFGATHVSVEFIKCNREGYTAARRSVTIDASGSKTSISPNRSKPGLCWGVLAPLISIMRVCRPPDMESPG
jgi:hypothetical protein